MTRPAGDRARRTRQDAELPADVPVGSRTPRPPYGHPDLLLGRAVALGVLTADEADLIGQTRLGDLLLEEIADTQGVSAQVLRMRRVRAERRLVTALGDGILTDPPLVHRRRRQANPASTLSP